MLSGILFVIRNGVRWRDAPREYGPHKTIYNRFIRWSRLGVFDRIFAELSKGGGTEQLMIDATHLKAHRTAPNGRKVSQTTDGICDGINPRITHIVFLFRYLSQRHCYRRGHQRFQLG